MKRTRLTLVLASLVALAAVFMYVGCGQNNSPTSSNSFDMRDAAIVRAMAIQNKHTDALMNIDGVVGTGVGVDANGNPVMKVFTRSSDVAGKIAISLDNLPVVVEETGEFTAHALTGRYRPVPIGVSVGNNNECAAGTIGCVVLRGGVKHILSNNHVLARENLAATGEDIVQPGRYDNKPLCANKVATDKVGDLTDFEPLSFAANGNNLYDAAIAEYSTTSVSCATLSGYYGLPSNTIVAAYLNQPIKKVGRTTSLTTGTVTAVNVTVTVGYTRGNARFTGQIVTSARFDKSGDSGSLVVTNDGNNDPIALLFAGTKSGQAIISPIAPVLQRFNATICNQ